MTPSAAVSKRIYQIEWIQFRWIAPSFPNTRWNVCHCVALGWVVVKSDIVCCFQFNEILDHFLIRCSRSSILSSRQDSRSLSFDLLQHFLWQHFHLVSDASAYPCHKRDFVGGLITISCEKKRYLPTGVDNCNDIC